MYQIIQKGIVEEVQGDIELIKMVVDFKKKFCPCKWANYDEILEGNCKLLPNKEALDKFSEDYDLMKNVLYGSYPSFEEIFILLDQFEKKLNQLIILGLTES